jgi:hypothetical protein
MFILAFFLPCILFFVIGRPLAGIVCFFLQFTLVGWIPAAIWAAYALGRHNSAADYARYYRYPCR